MKTPVLITDYLLKLYALVILGGVMEKQESNWESYFSSSEETIPDLLCLLRSSFLAVEREKWKKLSQECSPSPDGCRVVLTLALKFNSRPKEWPECTYFCLQAETVVETSLSCQK